MGCFSIAGIVTFLILFPVTLIFYYLAPIYFLWTRHDPVIAILLGGVTMPIMLLFGIGVLRDAKRQVDAEKESR